MMKKVTFAYNALEEVLKLFDKFSFVTGKLALAKSRTRFNIIPEYKIFMEERDNIYKKYWEIDPETNAYRVDKSSPKYKEFEQELIPLLTTTCEIEVMKITEDEFYAVDISNDKCDENDYTMLAVIFIDNEPTAEEK